jgi:hypothetical protein
MTTATKRSILTMVEYCAFFLGLCFLAFAIKDAADVNTEYRVLGETLAALWFAGICAVASIVRAMWP